MAHPLFDDPARLEQVMRVAHQKILKTLRFNPTGVEEQVLTGGVSADDILQEVTEALWESDPDELRGSWEALAVTIAHNKTVDAIRRAAKGRGPSGDEGDEIDVVSLDRPAGADGEQGPSGVEQLSDGRSAEDEFVAIHEQRVVWELAREHLDERELKILYDIHYLGRSRAEVGRELGVSGQRVGQIYAGILIRLWERLPPDPRFWHRWDPDADDNQAGPDDDQDDDDDQGDDKDDGEEGEA